MVVKWIKYFSWTLHDSTHNWEVINFILTRLPHSLLKSSNGNCCEFIYSLLCPWCARGQVESKKFNFFLHWLLMSSCVSDLPSKVVNLLTLLRFQLLPISLIISWVDLQSAQGEFIIKTISEIISLSVKIYDLSIYPSRFLCVLL